MPSEILRHGFKENRAKVKGKQTVTKENNKSERKTNEKQTTSVAWGPCAGPQGPLCRTPGALVQDLRFGTSEVQQHLIIMVLVAAAVAGGAVWPDVVVVVAV